MMDTLGLETVTGDGIGQCRELCNELMALQKSRAAVGKEIFDLMNFETRMKKNNDNALESQTVVAKDQGVPVGYVFSTIDMVTESGKAFYPDWASGTGKGFYPDWLEVPQKIGCLSNLYVRGKYRGTGLGSRLFSLAMSWLESFSDCGPTFVYISNGNDEAYTFYTKHGFVFSHDVFDGFITAAYKFK